jgi:DNA invertase Pin-like site-specific DNA recombinase
MEQWAARHPGAELRKPSILMHEAAGDLLLGRCYCKNVLHNCKNMLYVYAMKLGYARVSTDDQKAALQVAALKGAGVERIYVETASGGRWERPELHRLLEAVRPGDLVVVWKLDRVSRSLFDFLRVLRALDAAGAGFQSLTEQVDTFTPAGKMFTNMLGVFAEFERDTLKERTMAGLKEARKQGRIGGRPPKLTKVQRAEALKMLKNGKSQADVSRVFNVSPSTVCRLSA